MSRPVPLRFLRRYFDYVLRAFWTTLTGPFSAAGRLRVFQGGVGLGASPHRIPPELPALSLSDVFRAVPDLQVTHANAASGNVTLVELVVLCALCRNLCPERIFEIGTFDGRTTLNFILNTPPPGSVTTLDLLPQDLAHTRFSLAAGEGEFVEKPSSGARFADRPEAARIEQVFGDSGTFDFDSYTGRFDLVFVDGSHAYEYVKKDSETALHLLKPDGGLIVWHDYAGDWPDVTNALHELRQCDPRFRGLQWIGGTSLALMPLGKAMARLKLPRDGIE